MLWKQLKNFYHCADLSAVLEDTGYVPYYPNDEYIIEVEDEYGEMFISDSMQHIKEKDNEFFLFQIVYLADDPITITIRKNADDTNIPVKIYKKINVDD